MKAVGIYAGIGSQLVAAKNAGFEVVANCEPRTFESGETFEANFEGAKFCRKFQELLEITETADLVVGHPSCGSYSSINWRAARGEKQKPKDEINRFMFAVDKIRPKFFIMDNLPKMVLDYTADKWLEVLGENYYITPVCINNRGYGNAQRRARLYIIGSKKEIRYIPLPFEISSDKYKVTKDIIDDLLGKEGKVPNHYDVYSDIPWKRMTHVIRRGHTATFEGMKEFLKKYPEGRPIAYHKESGEMGARIGVSKVKYNGSCSTLSSVASQIHPVRLTPLTIREHLRLMGYPDDFVIVDHIPDKNNKCAISSRAYHQVNKGVCIQSSEFFIRQMKTFLEFGDYRPYGAGESGASIFNDNIDKFYYDLYKNMSSEDIIHVYSRVVRNCLRIKKSENLYADI